MLNLGDHLRVWKSSEKSSPVAPGLLVENDCWFSKSDGWKRKQERSYPITCPRLRSIGLRCGEGASAIVICLVLFCSCSAASQEIQTFIAEDPDTGERALYQLEIFGAGIGSVKYHVSGAYLPRTAIELYDGEIPTALADIDAESPGGESTTSKILAQYHQFLEQQAELEREANNAVLLSTTKDRRTVRRFFADVIADSMLSVSDLRSISEAGSDDPYRFRKLAYFISTKPLKVEDFQGEMGEIESTLNTMAQALSEARQQRRKEAEARRTQRKQKLQAVTSFLQGNPDLKEPQKAWELFGLITEGGQ